MNYLTTKTVLDSAFSRTRVTDPTLRAKAVHWLRNAMRDVLNEREWVFLEKTATALPVTDGEITLPADFGKEVFVKNGIYIFTTADRLTPSNAALADNCGGEPVGYTLTPTTLVFHPTTTGTADLTYVATLPTGGYTDGTDATIFPDEFEPLFERYLTTCFYEYDVDNDRLPVGLQLDAKMLRTLKKADNQRRPVPPLSRKGMVR